MLSGLIFVIWYLLFAIYIEAYSSVGRAAVSKTAGREFETYCACSS